MSPVNPSPFVRDLKPDLYQLWKKSRAAVWCFCQRQSRLKMKMFFPESEFPDDDCQEADYCDDSLGSRGDGRR